MYLPKLSIYCSCQLLYEDAFKLVNEYCKNYKFTVSFDKPP